MALKGIQEYIARDANNIALVFDSGLTQDIKMGSCVFQCDVRSTSMDSTATGRPRVCIL